MSYNYEDIIRGGKGNMSVIRFVRGTQEQFDKIIDKTNVVKPDLYMKDDTIYFVIPDETSGISALVDRGDRPESIEENPFLQESINSALIRVLLISGINTLVYKGII